MQSKIVEKPKSSPEESLLSWFKNELNDLQKSIPGIDQEKPLSEKEKDEKIRNFKDDMNKIIDKGVKGHKKDAPSNAENKEEYDVQYVDGTHAVHLNRAESNIWEEIYILYYKDMWKKLLTYICTVKEGWREITILRDGGTLEYVFDKNEGRNGEWKFHDATQKSYDTIFIPLQNEDMKVIKETIEKGSTVPSN